MNLTENDVLFTNHTRGRPRYRRVISLFGDYVYYSTGGDSTCACRKKTFKRWIFEANASMSIPS